MAMGLLPYMRVLPLASLSPKHSLRMLRSATTNGEKACHGLEFVKYCNSSSSDSSEGPSSSGCAIQSVAMHGTFCIIPVALSTFSFLKVELCLCSLAYGGALTSVAVISKASRQHILIFGLGKWHNCSIGCLLLCAIASRRTMSRSQCGSSVWSKASELCNENVALWAST